MPENLDLLPPTRVLLEGKPFWRFHDGTLLPVVSGGADDDGDDADDKDDGDTDSDDSDLGDKGKKALDNERARAKAEAKKARVAEKRAKDLEERLAKFEGDSKSEHEKALEKARKEAADEARKEVSAATSARLVKAEVRAVAGKKLADPEDAVRLLDLDDFEIDDDGEVDRKAITKAIDELVKSKPYLAGEKKTAGNGDGGARKDSDDKPLSPRDRLRRGYAANSK